MSYDDHDPAWREHWLEGDDDDYDDGEPRPPRRQAWSMGPASSSSSGGVIPPPPEPTNMRRRTGRAAAKSYVMSSFALHRARYKQRQIQARRIMDDYNKCYQLPERQADREAVRLGWEDWETLEAARINITNRHMATMVTVVILGSRIVGWVAQSRDRRATNKFQEQAARENAARRNLRPPSYHTARRSGQGSLF